MAQSPSRERLNKLLALAAQGEGSRDALLDELADLLLDWPFDYAQAMRAPFEALLEKTARDADGFARARLLSRIADRPELPLSLCNAFFLDADADARRAILARNQAACEDEPASHGDDAALVEAARSTVNGNFVKAIASALALPDELAARIVKDGHALAVAVKGCGMGRAAFSAVALISGSNAEQLCHFDDIPDGGARNLLASWRG